MLHGDIDDDIIAKSYLGVSAKAVTLSEILSYCVREKFEELVGDLSLMRLKGTMIASDNDSPCVVPCASIDAVTISNSNRIGVEKMNALPGSAGVTIPVFELSINPEFELEGAREWGSKQISERAEEIVKVFLKLENDIYNMIAKDGGEVICMESFTPSPCSLSSPSLNKLGITVFEHVGMCSIFR